jgi:hypothetical protein
MAGLQNPLGAYVANLVVRQGDVATQAGAAITGDRPGYAAGTPGYTDLPCCMYFYYVRVIGPKENTRSVTPVTPFRVIPMLVAMTSSD